MEIILCLLSGGMAAAVIKIIDNIIMYKMARRDKKEDIIEEKKEKSSEKFNEEQKRLHDEVNAISQGMKYVLYDRIKHLGTKYLQEGTISFEDRRIVHDMHSVYHNSLGGNGDLDSLMRELYQLPLKRR